MHLVTSHSRPRVMIIHICIADGCVTSYSKTIITILTVLIIGGRTQSNELLKVDQNNSCLR